ncbi:MAG: Fe-S protein assembly co-chaperone HscB [Chitinophagaceae bacterium]|nr:Fe-S protein assembly co-chaperone HscB [Chitinophagaceae bacterium]
MQTKFYELSKKYHPDLSFRLEGLQHEEALNLSAEINEAKKTLDDSYKRLEYILKLKNIISIEEKQTLSNAFLGEMMDINEQVMELEFGDKNPIQLQKIKNEIAQKEQELKAPLAAYFEQEELMIDENGLENLKEFYFKKKYLQRILDKLH